MDVSPVVNNTDFNAYFDTEANSGFRCGQVEFMTVMKYIHKYIIPDMKVLEIGTGHSRYSIELASKGYNVTAVEMLQVRLNELNSNITEAMKLLTFKGEITDLGFISDNTFDMTLALGPMYHLYSFEDKKKGISEAIRVTKPGGVIFVSYCMSDACISNLCFSQGQIYTFIKNGLLDPEEFKFHCMPDRIFDLVRKSDIDALMSEFNVMRLHYAATDLFAGYVSEAINNMDDKTFELYMKYHFSVCERNDLVGSAKHCVDIFRKRRPLNLKYVPY